MTDTFTSNDGIDPGVGTGDNPDQINPPGPNPAWDPVLNVLPTQFHSLVTPHFQQWDKAAQDRITSLNSDLESYNQYEPLKQYGVNMDDVAQALRLMHAVNNNPREIYDAIGESYGYNVAQQQLQSGNIPGAENGTIQQMTGQQENNQQIQQQPLNDPRVDRLQQGVDLMANIILQQQQEATNAQADSDLDNELSTLKTKYGDFDERFVLAYMNQGMSGDQAAQHFNTLKNEMLTNNPRPFAPGILGGTSSGNGSGVPSAAIDPTQLSGKETRNLVVEMLKAANRPS